MIADFLKDRLCRRVEVRGSRCLLLTAAKDRLNMIDITSTREREEDARGCYGPTSLRFSLSHPTKEQIVVNGQLW
jgi:hypothetical protein